MSDSVRSDPLLGPDWVPLADAIVRINREVISGSWRLQFLPSNDRVPSVFLQAAPRGDYLHVEVGGGPVGTVTLEDRDSALRLAGWHVSAAESPGDEELSREYPLPYRRAHRQLEDTEDLVALLRTLAVLLGVTPRTPLTFGPQWDDLLGWLGPFDRVDPGFWELSQDSRRLQVMRSLDQATPARREPPRETVTVPTEPDPGSAPGIVGAKRPTADATIPLTETLSTGRLMRVDFANAVLNGAQFEGARLSECRLRDARLEGANFRGSQLVGLDDGAALSAALPFSASRTSPVITRMIVDLLQQDQLRLPYLPRQLSSPLAMYDEDNFGTAAWGFPGSRQAYEFWPLVEQMARGDWTPRVMFGRGGHGMNSYAWTYGIVLDRVAVFGQVLRGLIYYDAANVATEWSQMMLAVEEFVTDVWPPDEDEGVVVVYNSMRGIVGASIVPTQGVDFETLREALATDARWSPGHGAREFLDHVKQWAEEGFE